MINRRAVREAVLQGLYALEIGGNTPSEILNNIIREKLSDDKAAMAFAERLFIRTIDMREELDGIISDQINNWKISRLAIVDKLLLRIALCEFIRFNDIPSKVTINESIELAKEFSTEKSGKFINGILDAVLGKFHEQGKMTKSGRGLIDSTRKKEG